MRMLHEQKQAPWHGLGRGISTSNQKIQHQICQELMVQASMMLKKTWRFPARSGWFPALCFSPKNSNRERRSFEKKDSKSGKPSNNKSGLEIPFVTPHSSQVVQVVGLCSDRKNRFPFLFHVGMLISTWTYHQHEFNPWTFFRKKKKQLHINHSVKESDPRTVSDEIKMKQVPPRPLSGQKRIKHRITPRSAWFGLHEQTNETISWLHPVVKNVHNKKNGRGNKSKPSSNINFTSWCLSHPFDKRRTSIFSSFPQNKVQKVFPTIPYLSHRSKKKTGSRIRIPWNPG